MKTRPWPLQFQTLTAGLLAAALTTLAACAINPATGQNQLSFFNEAEEIQLGVQVDQEILANSRTYDDPKLEAYVSELGMRLAAVSERPDLPWSFRIADDEIVNAFALPGGRIYVTRGLLAHLSREAELAGVLGHEIGHVTARHSVNGLSRELAISAGVVAALVLLDSGETAEIVTGLGLNLLFLKFGRNQERQADQLGVRYVRGAGLDPHGVVDVLRVLQVVSSAQSDGWFPVWLSTHPDPDKRWQRLADETGLGPGRPASSLQDEVDTYVARLDGLVYGSDPRNGVLEENAWVQLRDGYQMAFPVGWEIEREGQTLAAENAPKDSLVMLLPQLGATVHEAADSFADEEGVVTHEFWDESLGGLEARLTYFEADLGDGTEDEPTRGLAAFVRTQGRIVAVLGLSAAEFWPERRREIERSVRSIGRIVRPERYAAEPQRLKVVTLDRAMNATEIARRYSPDAEAGTIALLNQMDENSRIEAGRRVKVLVGAR